MADTNPTIDVVPIDATRERIEPDSSQQAQPDYQVRNSTFVTEQAKSSHSKSFLSRVVRILLGLFCILIGIPMLILPGPGLLAIGAGILLIGSGIGSFFRKGRVT